MHENDSLCYFFYREGVVLPILLPMKSSVTGKKYNCKILHELKRTKTSIKGLLLLHDYAPVHKSKLVTYFFSKDGVIVIPRPAYSYDL